MRAAAASGELTKLVIAAVIASQRVGGCVGGMGLRQLSSLAVHSIEPDLSSMMKTSVGIGLASWIIGTQLASGPNPPAKPPVPIVPANPPDPLRPPPPVPPRPPAP